MLNREIWGNLALDFSECQVLKNTRANPALLQLHRARKVLLLQGPVGPFFDRLTQRLQQGGASVHRVVFQGGDRHDCQAVQPIAYQQSLAQWPAVCRALVEDLGIDCIVLFGQSRKYHQPAMALAKSLGLCLVVLEEGYLRPGFVTMELGGVNGYSQTLDQYVWRPVAGANRAPRHTEVGVAAQGIQADISARHFQKMAWHASKHYIAMWRDRRQFAQYQHHRPTQPLGYAVYWLRSWLRKLLKRGPDRAQQAQLLTSTQPYFLVPLQHDGDAQIRHHSPFSENAEFIIQVLLSFSRHASVDARLVFRQHPHARGGPGHGSLIHRLAIELGLGPRVVHMVEGDTPDLAQHSAGVVLINSTVGLQAIERGAPLMVMGDALYKRDGLCFMGPLDEFWRHAKPPRPEAAQRFLAQIKNLTQASASVYALRDEALRWGPILDAVDAKNPC